ncbi:MAG TPA: helix-turn-helix transcriptional regulator [Thermoanaerobaculia bacterium]|nr:helix-turn-helix transcriptional regulator [Thermoanaerobaculia bacterium]
MKSGNRLARLFRALTDLTQQQLAGELGINRETLAQYEGGKIPPQPERLELIAARAGLTVAQGEELLQLYDTLSRPRLRQGQGPDDLLADVGEPLRSRFHRAFQRLLRLHLPGSPPRAEDRDRAKELFETLKGLTRDQRTAVVRIAGEYQSWALCELVVEASMQAADALPRDLAEAEGWARLASEIAERVPGPEEWRRRVQGYAAAAPLYALRTAGSDPEGLLDPGRVFGLEGC